MCATASIFTRPKENSLRGRDFPSACCWDSWRGSARAAEALAGRASTLKSSVSRRMSASRPRSGHSDFAMVYHREVAPMTATSSVRWGSIRARRSLLPSPFEGRTLRAAATLLKGNFSSIVTDALTGNRSSADEQYSPPTIVRRAKIQDQIPIATPGTGLASGSEMPKGRLWIGKSWTGRLPSRRGCGEMRRNAAPQPPWFADVIASIGSFGGLQDSGVTCTKLLICASPVAGHVRRG